MSIFTIIYFIWLLSEVLLNRLMRSGKTDQQHADRNSLLIIWATIAVATSLSVFVAMRYRCLIAASLVLPYAGLAVIIGGVILRLLVVRSLGRSFTVDVTIRQSHTLKQDGIYHYLRHPSYAASLLSFIGFGISLNSWLSLGIILFTVVPAFLYRICVEEKALAAHFGDAYLDYKKATKALIPFVY